MSRLVFGCGYLGCRVAQQFLDSPPADAVYAVTRQPERAAEFADLGLQPIVADVTKRETLQDLPATDTVLVAVGYDRSSGLSIHDTYVGGLANILDAISPQTRRVIYISSTGVYGQADGGVVDEQSHCEPVREGGKACLAAEELLRAHPRGRNAVILRLAGIYGPGRLPRSAPVLAGVELAIDPDTYLNLIHVEDAATATIAAEQLAEADEARCYCVCDDSPLKRGEYFAELARQLGAPSPRFAAGEADKSQRGGGDKRICNAKMHSELGVTLSFPTWPDGLAASLRVDRVSES